MVYDHGMASEIGFVSINRRLPLPPELATRCHAVVRQIIEAQSERARKLLTDHRVGLDRTVAALVERNRLLQHEVSELLALPEESKVAEPPA
ncbi:MAG: hypothetical protein ACRESZ_14725 [Methylococcales bacterium]